MHEGVEGSLEAICGQLLRQALDEVIDMPRTGRFSIDQLEKTEKTYIGTKVEIIFRDTFSLPWGELLDLSINGTEVDVKNTVLNDWAIPQEAIDHICVLLQTRDDRSIFNFGLLLCKDAVLNSGKNRDGKRTVSLAGKEEILWIVRNGNLPRNIFLHMDEEQRKSILDTRIGAKIRLVKLFREFQGDVISRHLVECVAQQKDPMKRLRGNGGARDILRPEGLDILWGGSKADRKLLANLGYANITNEQFVCLAVG